MKNFVSVSDVDNIDFLVQKALSYKANPLKDQHLGQGKRAGLLFFNPSLRTRVSTQIAAKNLGLDPIVLNVGSEGWALEFADGAIMNGTTVEHIKDAAPILGSYFDLLCVRSFPKFISRDEDESDHVIKSIIKYSGVPVISLESATRHPLQSLADTITITEQFAKSFATGKKPKVVLTWAPHIKSIPHCVANSFAEWMMAWGRTDFVITHPKGYELSETYTRGAHITHSQAEALDGADFVYVKNWSGYQDYGKVLGEYPEWMLTEKHFNKTFLTKIMHCLPLRRNVELSDEILDGPRSILTELAKNRVWSAQAVLSNILTHQAGRGMKQNLTLVKIGGNIIDDESALSEVLSHFAALGGNKILVHGGKIATQIATALNKPQQMIEGRRITDPETLKIITMVYGGLVNKTIVAKLQALKVSALGITGADADVIRSKKRGLSPNGVDYGFVGDVTHVKTERFQEWLSDGVTPVIAPLTHDGAGQLLNTNADSMANAVAVALSPFYTVTLIYSFEKSGVLTDVNNESSLISKITPTLYSRLKSEGKVFDGMIPKLDNAFAAITHGVARVILGKATVLPQLVAGTSGTSLTHE